MEPICGMTNPRYSDDNSDCLQNFCLTSKRFYRVGMSVLDQVLWDTNDIDDREKHIRKFIDNPDAAARVRCLAISGDEQVVRRTSKTDFSTDIGQDIQHVARRVDIENKGEWIQKVRAREEYSVVALLVSLLPNLETICFGVCVALQDEFHWTLAFVRKHPEHFRKVQSVKTIYEREEHGWNPSGVAYLMELPSLRQLHLARGWDRRKKPGWHLSAHGIDNPPMRNRPDPTSWPKRTSASRSSNSTGAT